MRSCRRRIPGLRTLGGMDDRTEPTAPTLGLVPRLIIGGLILFVAITVIGSIVGAILAVVRTVLIVAVVAAVLWAVLASRRD